MTGSVHSHGPTVHSLPPQIRPLARLSPPGLRRSGCPPQLVSRGRWLCTRAGVRVGLGRTDDRGPEDHEARCVVGDE
ncbi:hypothetical protein [Streptomyces sp. NPDC005752]|uniref:hypothetical protein n=1 Tax=Streptomyces sp. NPDC005752 TaxID=3157065 RepID=UPI00340D3067